MLKGETEVHHSKFVDHSPEASDKSKHMRCGVFGGGAWGMALSSVLWGKGHTVLCWEPHEAFRNELRKRRIHPRYPQLEIPSNMHFVAAWKDAIEGIDLCVEAVTAPRARVIFQDLQDHWGDFPILSTSKGVELKDQSFCTLTQVAEEIYGSTNFFGRLSGPSLADEVIQQKWTEVVCSTFSNEVWEASCCAFKTSYFKLERKEDLIGVDLCGSLKNSIAITCGVCDGLSLGSNARSALLSRGSEVCSAMCQRYGGQVETCLGLAGMGDLILTATSPLSRNYRLGTLLGKGYSLEEAKKEIGMAVEGVNTCTVLSKSCSLPFFKVLSSLLNAKKKPLEAILLLLESESCRFPS